MVAVVVLGEDAVVLEWLEHWAWEAIVLLDLMVEGVEEDFTAVVVEGAVMEGVAAPATPLASSCPTSRACRAGTATSP